MLNFSS